MRIHWTLHHPCSYSVRLTRGRYCANSTRASAFPRSCVAAATAYPGALLRMKKPPGHPGHLSGDVPLKPCRTRYAGNELGNPEPGANAQSECEGPLESS